MIPVSTSDPLDDFSTMYAYLYAMTQSSLAQALAFPPPPQMRWPAASREDEIIKGLERSINSYAAEVRVWRTGLAINLQNLDQHFRDAGDALDTEQVAISVAQAIEGMLPELEKKIASFEGATGDRPDVKAELQRVAGTKYERLFKKLLHRIENIRVEQHKALVDAHYGLLSYLSELQPEERIGPFSDGSDLEASLRATLG